MKLAVFFPGIGYHCDKPLLYYARKLAAQAGYDETLQVGYTYEKAGLRGNREKMKEAFESLYAQTKEALADVDFGAYDEILFVSKSVGTIIASAYAAENGIDAGQILYTPLEDTFSFPHRDAVAFIGTADPWSDPEEVIKLAEAQNVPIHVYEGLNHSLECGDTKHNLEVLCSVMEITDEYMGKRAPAEG